MQIEETRIGSTLVIAVEGRIDAHSAQIFHDRVLGHVDRGETSVLLDFAALDFISSAGLRVVLMAAKRLQQADGRFAICALQEPVGEVFRVSGFVSIMDIVPDRQAALARLKSD
jgi:anti-anti-sigma factor